MEKWNPPDFSGWELAFKTNLYADPITDETIAIEIDNGDVREKDPNFRKRWFGTRTTFTTQDGEIFGREINFYNKGVRLKYWGLAGDHDHWQWVVLINGNWYLLKKDCLIQIEHLEDDSKAIIGTEINIVENDIDVAKFEIKK